MKVLEVSKDNLVEFNVLYDAVTKHDNAEGISGLRKITKLLDKFDEFGILDTESTEPGKRDVYSLKDDTKTYNLFLEDEEFNSIKQWFDKVQWAPMKARTIVKALDWLEKAKDHKPQLVKDAK